MVYVNNRDEAAYLVRLKANYIRTALKLLDQRIDGDKKILERIDEALFDIEEASNHLYHQNELWGSK